MVATLKPYMEAFSVSMGCTTKPQISTLEKKELKELRDSKAGCRN